MGLLTPIANYRMAQNLDRENTDAFNKFLAFRKKFIIQNFCYQFVEYLPNKQICNVVTPMVDRNR